MLILGFLRSVPHLHAGYPSPHLERKSWLSSPPAVQGDEKPPRPPETADSEPSRIAHFKLERRLRSMLPGLLLNRSGKEARGGVPARTLKIEEKHLTFVHRLYVHLQVFSQFLSLDNFT